MPESVLFPSHDLWRGDGTWSVPAGTGVTSVSATSPLASSGGTTPTISITGLSSLGSANQLPGVNSGATGLEYKTLSGTSNQISVTHGAGTITLATPQDIATGSSPTFVGLNLSGLTASQAVFTDGSKNLVSNAITGSGNVVMSASPTLTGTVTAATVNATNFNGILGATTPAAASVTTLNASGQSNFGNGSTDYLRVEGSTGTANVFAVGSSTDVNASIYSKGAGAVSSVVRVERLKFRLRTPLPPIAISH